MAAPKGTRPPGGSRKGCPNKATAAREAKVAASGLTPLDFMLKVLRNTRASFEDRKWAAASAAPYVHPRLNSVHHGGAIGLHDVTDQPISEEQWRSMTPTQPIAH